MIYFRLIITITGIAIFFKLTTLVRTWRLEKMSRAVTLLNEIRRDKLISDYALSIYQWVSHSFLCQVICVFGTVTNILNMVCFVKLGFKDPVNVTLFGMIYN